ncbi:MAG: hypothetical protein JSS75_00055 [Bacteroidetes bacterium]|nr:hypothetical protein [Bacteroidota bacterium]
MTILESQIIDCAREDERVRAELAQSEELFGAYAPRMEEVHVRNATVLEAVIAQMGWPVSQNEEVMNAAKLIILHAISLPSFQKRMLELLKSSEHGYPDQFSAYLEDRILVFSGKQQKYGTQFDWNANGMLSPYPIADAEHVNERRAAVGLDSLEAATQRMRRRAAEEGELPPADMNAYTIRRLEWMMRVGWTGDTSDNRLCAVS